MAINARRALSEGLDDVASARGVVLYVAFALYTIATLPIHQTLTRDLNEWVVEVAELSTDQFAIPPTPLALDVGLPVLLAGLAVVFLVGEFLRIVAVRAFASDSMETLPTDEITEGLGRTFGVLLVASLAVQVVVYGGLAVFIIPGLIAAVLTVFVRQAVVLDGDGVLEAFRSSVSTVTDNVGQLLLLLIVLLVLSFVIGLPTVFLAPEAAARPIAGAVLGTAVTLYGIAVITRAYQHADEPADGPGDVDEGATADREPTV